MSRTWAVRSMTIRGFGVRGQRGAPVAVGLRCNGLLGPADLTGNRHKPVTDRDCDGHRHASPGPRLAVRPTRRRGYTRSWRWLLSLRTWQGSTCGLPCQAATGQRCSRGPVRAAALHPIENALRRPHPGMESPSAYQASGGSLPRDGGRLWWVGGWLARVGGAGWDSGYCAGSNGDTPVSFCPGRRAGFTTQDPHASSAGLPASRPDGARRPLVCRLTVHRRSMMVENSISGQGCDHQSGLVRVLPSPTPGVPTVTPNTRVASAPNGPAPDTARSNAFTESNATGSGA